MKRIRICEESEARLMIQEGCFSDYVKMWSGEYPQEAFHLFLVRGCSKYGLSLLESVRILRESDPILFEVGDKVLFKKQGNCIKLYQKVGNFWILKEGIGLENIASEDVLFSQPEKARPFIKERDILKARSLTEFSNSIMNRKLLQDWKNPLLQFGDHELWKKTDDHSLIIYSHLPSECRIELDLETVARHIEQYQKTYKPALGLM